MTERTISAVIEVSRAEHVSTLGSLRKWAAEIERLAENIVGEAEDNQMADYEQDIRNLKTEYANLITLKYDQEEYIDVLNYFHDRADESKQVDNWETKILEQMTEREPVSRRRAAEGREMHNFGELFSSLDSEPKNTAPKNRRVTAGNDDEIMITTESKSFKCVLTQSDLVQPIRKPCGHVYSKVAIEDYIRSKGGNAPCPVGGCGKTVNYKSLEPDYEMMKAMRIRARQKRRGAQQ